MAAICAPFAKFVDQAGLAASYSARCQTKCQHPLDNRFWPLGAPRWIALFMRLHIIYLLWAQASSTPYDRCALIKINRTSTQGRHLAAGGKRTGGFRGPQAPRCLPTARVFGDREICKGAREDKASWSALLKHLKKHAFKRIGTGAETGSRRAGPALWQSNAPDRTGLLPIP
jgi:hypothetical protein